MYWYPILLSPSFRAKGGHAGVSEESPYYENVQEDNRYKCQCKWRRFEEVHQGSTRILIEFYYFSKT